MTARCRLVSSTSLLPLDYGCKPPICRDLHGGGASGLGCWDLEWYLESKSPVVALAPLFSIQL